MAAQKVYAEPQRGHVSLGGPLRVLLFWVPVLALGLVIVSAEWHEFQKRMSDAEMLTRIAVVVAVAFVLVVVWGILVSGLRVAAQWERGVVLRLGKFQTVRGPGIMYIVPFVDNVRFVDLRLLTLNIPSQQVITKDNVPAAIDGVLFYRIADAEKAVIGIQDYAFAIAQYARLPCATWSAGSPWTNFSPNANRFKRGSPTSSSSASATGACTSIPFACRTSKCRRT